MSLSTARVDLRVESVDDVLTRVEHAFGASLERDTLVRKRRTIGARTDRGTWVRVERRGLDRIDARGWNGAEAAGLLEGVVRPEWYGCVVWRDQDAPVMWRADETSLLPAPPIGSSVLAKDPGLSDAWWEQLNASLDALAGQETVRTATPDTVTITQELVTETIRSVFGGGFDTTVASWVPAHADLNWANMTAPVFCLFDWEDWGNAPRGLDAASLWGNSLAVPELAERVLQERAADFECRDGKLMTLFVCAKITGPHALPDDPRLDAAARMADRIVADIRNGAR
ncbi:hypothetical protein [Streptacidiphilus fuscans]|uniref:Uncharacterized protein n=1 Tax=Streptacidiphilus fuscans TaxID=2789292 RepID=A0A931FIL0_9ACTN|nr:hypothetical protein [Streptacidiphilus fuscans]MBF9071884.1 hypothetical protein [Streptacidiphilus fuscans]